jgi:hypothetical protein
MWKLECSTQDLSETRPLQNNETARQKGISFNGFIIDSLENYQVFKQKPFPLFVKTHTFAQNIIF